MSDFVTTEVLSTTAAIDFEGSLVDTNAFPSIDKNLRPQIGKRSIKSSKAQFTLSCTVFTGTGFQLDVVAVVDGVDHIVGAFTDLAGTGVETIVIDFCPDIIKIVGTEDAISAFTCKVHCTRF